MLPQFLHFIEQCVFRDDPPKDKWLLVFICLCSAIPLLYGVEWIDYVVAIDHCPELFCDFTKHYLPQAQRTLENGGIQNGWFYPPVLALLLTPLTLFSNPTFFWGLINAGSIALMALWVSREMNIRWFCALLLCMCSLPVLHSFKWGQISILLYTLIFWGLKNGLKATSTAIALTGSIKIYPLILSVLLLKKERAQALLILIVAFVFLALVFPMIVLGTDQTILFWTNMFTGAQTVSLIAPKFGGQALWPVLHRYFSSGSHLGLSGSSALIFTVPQALISLIWLALSGIVVVLTARSFNRTKDLVTQAVLVLSATLILLSPSWHHYASCLPFIFATLWKNAQSHPSRFLLITGWLIQAFPAVFMGYDVYFTYSAYGGTFWSMLLIWSASIPLSAKGKNIDKPQLQA